MIVDQARLHVKILHSLSTLKWTADNFLVQKLGFLVHGTHLLGGKGAQKAAEFLELTLTRWGQRSGVHDAGTGCLGPSPSAQRVAPRQKGSFRTSFSVPKFVFSNQRLRSDRRFAGRRC